MKDLIVIREPNSSLPEDFRKKLLADYPTAFGYASPQGDSHIDNDPFAGDDVDLEDALSKIESSYKKDRVFYHFVEADILTEINLESLQPFNVIKDDENRTLLSVMLSGEFPAYNDKNEDGETFTPQYHCVNEYIKLLVDELYELSGKDISKTMEMLLKKVSKDKLEALLGDSATILLIPHKGTATSISNEKNSGQVANGVFATNHLGFAAEKPKPTMKEIAAAKAEKKEDAAPTPGGTKIKPEELYAPLLRDNRFVLLSSILHVRPPPNANWKEVRTFWNTHSMMDRPKDPKTAYAGFPADKLRANSPLMDLRAKLMGEEKPKPKTADSEQGPAKPPENGKREELKMTLLIPKNQKEKYLEWKNKGAFPTTDIATLQASLKEYPAASVQLGENITDIMMYSNEALARLVHDVGNQLTISLLHQMRCEALGITAEDTPDEVPEPQKEEKAPEKKETAPVAGKKLTMKDIAAMKKAS